ncbi:acyl-CoA dehydrogenase family protein [Nocardia sp. NPDC127606]|uniref:acyl-CoA dehydrogenase family protein n=1 Tax=Nocardia sp. NPDC127606 TaxID=3345406 RepID=UPI003626F76C
MDLAVQRQIAEAEIQLDAAHALLETMTRDADAGVDLGVRTVPRLFSAKEVATRTAENVIDTAVQVVGASSVSRRNELERLYRDVRTGQLHPPKHRRDPRRRRPHRPWVCFPDTAVPGGSRAPSRHRITPARIRV